MKSCVQAPNNRHAVNLYSDPHESIAGVRGCQPRSVVLITRYGHGHSKQVMHLSIIGLDLASRKQQSSLYFRQHLYRWPNTVYFDASKQATCQTVILVWHVLQFLNLVYFMERHSDDSWTFKGWEEFQGTFLTPGNTGTSY